jgi:hypothetical protein
LQGAAATPPRTTPIAAQIDQLVKLLGLLGSSFDGEVLNAARKAEALRLSLDSTWEQLLANGSTSTLTEEQMARIYAAEMQKGEALGYQRGMADAQGMAPPQQTRVSIEVADDIAWIERVLAAAEQAETDGYLDEFEVDFSASMRAKVSRFGRATYVSQKQFDALRRLESSLRRRGYL